MSDTPDPGQPSTPETPQTPGTAEATQPALDPKEIEEGKLFAALSYGLSIIGLPFFIVPLVMRNNGFALFHAKQCLLIWIVALIGYGVSLPLTFVCVGFVTLILTAIIALVWEVMGIIASTQGKMTPLFLIGPYAEKWFAGITKVSKP